MTRPGFDTGPWSNPRFVTKSMPTSFLLEAPAGVSRLALACRKHDDCHPGIDSWQCRVFSDVEKQKATQVVLRAVLGHAGRTVGSEFRKRQPRRWRRRPSWPVRSRRMRASPSGGEAQDSRVNKARAKLVRVKNLPPWDGRFAASGCLPLLLLSSFLIRAGRARCLLGLATAPPGSRPIHAGAGLCRNPTREENPGGQGLSRLEGWRLCARWPDAGQGLILPGKRSRRAPPSPATSGPSAGIPHAGAGDLTWPEEAPCPSGRS
jgi:hypothetical protein